MMMLLPALFRGAGVVGGMELAALQITRIVRYDFVVTVLTGLSQDPRKLGGAFVVLIKCGSTSLTGLLVSSSSTTTTVPSAKLD